MVEVEITVVSLCHTDLSLGVNDWELSQYPMVAGHEGVGIIRRAGSLVKSLAVGERVAVGWMRHCYTACRPCQQGDESLCHKLGAAGTSLIFSGPGCFAERVRVDERFAFPVPDSCKSTAIAPMLCAGITVFRPLRLYANFPSARVGIVGIGGLGHLAIKFAKHIGCTITAFSRGTEKREICLKMGAHSYVDSTNKQEMETTKCSLDVILYCASGGNSEAYAGLLRNGGTLVQLGVPPVEDSSSTKLNIIPFVFGSLQYAGSGVGGTIHTNEMLQLAGSYDIEAEGTVLPIAELPKSVETLHLNPKSAPFRFIFTTSAWNAEKDF